MSIRILRLFALLPAFCAVLTAQVDTGVLSGRVSDNTLSVIPSAGVVITNLGTNYQLQLETNADGRYVSPPLPPGRYRIEVSQEGFRAAAKAVDLNVSDRPSIDFVLELGVVSETVTVQELAAVLQTETTTLSTLRSEREIKSLPINSRNAAEFIRFTPGVVPAQTLRASGLALSQQRGNTSNSVNGASWADNNFLVDGVQNNGNHQGWGLMNHPELEAIEQYRVETSVPDSRFARSGATVNVVYKSGTNEFHGVLFEFLRNSELDARNYFVRGPKPPLKRNFFGGTLGGPLGKKDGKTFFFVSFEGERTRQGVTTVATVPTAGMRTGDFGELLRASRPITIYDPTTTRRNPSGSGLLRDPFANNVIPTALFNPTSKKLIDQFPLPNSAGLASNYTISPSDIRDGNQGTIKIDREFSAGSRGFFRMTKGQNEFVTSRPLGAVATPFVAVDIPVTQAVLSYTHLLSTSVINQTRVGVSRQPLVSDELNGGERTSELFGIPNVNVDELTAGLPRIQVNGMENLGANNNRPAIIAMTNYQFSNNLDATIGNHTLKSGVDLVAHQTNAHQSPSTRGLFQWNTIYTNNPASAANTGFGAAELLLGKPAFIELNGLTGTRGLRQSDWGVYIQDDWKARPNLTLNLGLRYEYTGNFSQAEVYDRMAQFDIETGLPAPVNSGKFPWRTGVAPDRNNWAPRVGLAYQANPKTVVRAAYGVYYVVTLVAIGQTLASNPPFFVNSRITNDQGNFAGARAVNEGPLRTSDPNASGQVRRGVDAGFSNPYTQQWNFAIQRQLPAGQQWTVAYVGSKSTGLIRQLNFNQAVPGDGPIDPRRRWPQHGGVMMRQSADHYSYHGLQTAVVKRFSKGVHYQLAYTYSHLIGNDNKGGEGGVGPVPIFDLTRERGNGETDIRHMFRYTFGYELPFGKGKPWLSGSGGLLNAIAGGWEVNGVLSLYSGFPFDVTSNSNTLNIGETSRPNRIGDGNLPTDARTIDRWFDVDAFTNPAFRQWGDSGRNILYGPGTQQLDLSLFKTFSLGESKRLQFRGEFFNVTNTPQFNQPASNIGTPTAGLINSAGSEPALQRTQRQLQVAVKFWF